MTKRMWVLVLVLSVVGYIGAQAPAGSSLAFNTAGTCGAPAVGSTIICGTTTGLQQSINGAAYTVIGGSVTIPVTSVFGRTGAIAAASGDYSYAQLSSPPTTINCSTVTISSVGLVASGCTIK